jgi:hypothetical protein
MSPSLSLNTQVASTAETLSIPPATAFKTFTVKVKSILPEDNQGLPHQNFVVTAADGQVWEVNNDTHYGSKVIGLAVGEALTIKGVTYKDTNKQGIHWTHKANKPDDAGWIKDPGGKIYQ